MATTNNSPSAWTDQGGDFRGAVGQRGAGLASVNPNRAELDALDQHGIGLDALIPSTLNLQRSSRIPTTRGHQSDPTHGIFTRFLFAQIHSLGPATSAWAQKAWLHHAKALPRNGYQQAMTIC